MKLLATATAMAFFLAGCATTGSSVHSKAAQIGWAGGLSDVHDTAVPQSEIHDLDTKVYNSTFNSMLLMNDNSLGLSKSSSVGFGIAAALLTPRSVSSQDSVFAWMPSTEAKNEIEAKNKLLSLEKNAIETALTSMGIKFVKYHATDKNAENYQTYQIFGGKLKNCEPVGNCAIVANVKTPIANEMSPALLNQKTSYAFVLPRYMSNFGDSVINIYVEKASKDNAQFKNVILSSISKELPDWVFIYSAPRDKEYDRFPAYILTQGKPEFFVVPKL